MEKTLTATRSRSFKKQVLINIKKLGYTYDKSTAFFLEMILDAAEDRILYQKILERPLRPSSIVVRRPAKPLQEKPSPEQSIKTFISALNEETDSSEITMFDLYRVLNKLCPMWPFCK
jgi:hypothetical protein